MAASSSRFAKATATVATVATVDMPMAAGVAKIAGVAVAVPRKLPFLSRLANLMMLPPTKPD